MNIPDAMALRMPVTDTGRGATALFITSPSDDEVVAFWRGACAFDRGDPGTIEDSDRVYPNSMICRVAWRVGWIVAEKSAMAPKTHNADCGGVTPEGSGG